MKDWIYVASEICYKKYSRWPTWSELAMEIECDEEELKLFALKAVDLNVLHSRWTAEKIDISTINYNIAENEKLKKILKMN